MVLVSSTRAVDLSAFFHIEDGFVWVNQVSRGWGGLVLGGKVKVFDVRVCCFDLKSVGGNTAPARMRGNEGEYESCVSCLSRFASSLVCNCVASHQGDTTCITVHGVGEK